MFNTSELNTSFRVLIVYDIGTDEYIVRFDILTNCGSEDSQNDKKIEFTEKTKQLFNTNKLFTSETLNSALLVPRTVERGLSVQVNDKELVGTLRAMADKLEAEM